MFIVINKKRTHCIYNSNPGWVPQIVEIAKLNDPKFAWSKRIKYEPCQWENYDVAKMYRDKMSPDFDIIKVDKN